MLEKVFFAENTVVIFRGCIAGRAEAGRFRAAGNCPAAGIGL